MLKQQITEEELRRELAACAAVSETAVVKLLEELSRIAARETKLNGGFLLPGIGMIENAEQFERTGVNPATGEKIKIPRRIKLRFQFASRFTKICSREGD
jgi:nucleoid DNA-binding protein